MMGSPEIFTNDSVREQGFGTEQCFASYTFSPRTSDKSVSLSIVNAGFSFGP